MRLPGRIPVTISPFFWVVAALIGFVYTLNLMGTLIWIVIIFISVLFHEYGHALTSLFFGQRPRIALVPFGGVTYPEGPKLKLWKEFIVVLNGPIFGFILFLIATVLLQVPLLKQPVLALALRWLQIINLFWTVLNLLPVMPLDGGQLLRIVLEGIFGAKGLKYTLLASMVISVGFSLTFFLLGAFLIGAIFFLFAFQNFETWRRMRSIAEPDRREDLRMQLEQADQALKSGNTSSAIAILHGIRNQTNEGMIYRMATDTLAKIKFEEGDINEAYDLLCSIKGELEVDSKLVLHEAAFDQKDWKLVLELGGECFQYEPSKELALRTSMAAAQLGDGTSAVGWLKASQKEGLENLAEIAEDKRFDPIRETESWKSFTSSS